MDAGPTSTSALQSRTQDLCARLRSFRSSSEDVRADVTTKTVEEQNGKSQRQQAAAPAAAAALLAKQISTASITSRLDGLSVAISAACVPQRVHGEDGRVLATSGKSSRFDPDAWLLEFCVVMDIMNAKLSQAYSRHKGCSHHTVLNTWIASCVDIAKCLGSQSAADHLATSTATPENLQRLWSFILTAVFMSGKSQAAEMRLIIIPSLTQEAWQHHQPHPHKSSRCSSALVFWGMHMRRLAYECHKISGVPFRRAKLKQLRDITFSTASEIAQFYGSYVPGFLSRARVMQYRVDVLYIVLTVLSINELFRAEKTADVMQGATDASATESDENGGSESKAAQVTSAETVMLNALAAQLLVQVSLLTGPCELVTKRIKELIHSGRHEKSSSTTGAAPIELVRNIIGALGTRASPQILLAVPSEVFNPVAYIRNSGAKGLDISDLKDVELPWEAWLCAANSELLSRDMTINAVTKRHELGEWDYPPLTEKQETDASDLREALEIYCSMSQ